MKKADNKNNYFLVNTFFGSKINKQPVKVIMSNKYVIIMYLSSNKIKEQ